MTKTTTSTFPPSSSNAGLPVQGRRGADPHPVLAWSVPTGAWRCQVRSTSVDDGDFAVASPASDVEQRRRSIVDAPWTVLHQVHGTTVVMVTAPGEQTGSVADGAIAVVERAPVAVTTADCAPVVLIGDLGVAVVHAGWRGALAGIIEAAAEGLRASGASPVATLLGPCIGPSAYEFGPDDLENLVSVYGRGVRGRSGTGRASLDLPALIGAACEAAGWPRPARPPCTSDPRYYSHRSRGDKGRQTTVAWLESAGG